MTVYIMKENIKDKKGVIKTHIFVVNAFSKEKANKLFFERICGKGELMFDVISDYYKELREYINIKKLVLNDKLEYLLIF
jgi:hypothetical protein